MVRRLAGSFLLLGTVAAQVGVDGQDTGWTVYLRRAGPVQVGMSLRQVRGVLDDHSAFLEGNAPVVSLDDCAYITSAKLPSQLGLMVERGRVVRIDVWKRGIATASGIQVGATEDEVKVAYKGRIDVQPHKYDPAGHYLRYVPADASDRRLGMVFETDGQRVTSFRAGTVGAISLVEGCA